MGMGSIGNSFTISSPSSREAASIDKGAMSTLENLAKGQLDRQLEKLLKGEDSRQQQQLFTDSFQPRRSQGSQQQRDLPSLLGQ